MSPSSIPTYDLRVVILNQYYVPDVASTGHLLSELAEYLVEQGADVTVIASQPSYGPKETWTKCPRHAVESGIKVTRMWTTRFPKDNIIGRTINSLTFLLQLTLRVMFRRHRGEVFLYTTNPPYLAIIGAFTGLFRNHPYVFLLHDSYPQLPVLIGTIRKNGIIEKLWHACNRLMYRRADQSIVLCKAAKRLVCETYGVEPDRVHIIHNWADPDELKPKKKTDNPFAKEHGLVEPFTVLYSGNLGLYYEFETILAAADLLRNEKFKLVFIGAGGKKEWIAKQVKQRKLTNTILLPYQPFERLPDSLTACDASLVTIQNNVEGISYPSKLYASLSIGKPILAISERGSELLEQVVPTGAGLWFELGDAEGLAEGIRELMRNPAKAEEMGSNARALFEREYTLQASAEKYAHVLKLAKHAMKS